MAERLAIASHVIVLLAEIDVGGVVSWHWVVDRRLSKRIFAIDVATTHHLDLVKTGAESAMEEEKRRLAVPDDTSAFVSGNINLSASVPEGMGDIGIAHSAVEALPHFIILVPAGVGLGLEGGEGGVSEDKGAKLASGTSALRTNGSFLQHILGLGLDDCLIGVQLQEGTHDLVDLGFVVGSDWGLAVSGRSVVSIFDCGEVVIVTTSLLDVLANWEPVSCKASDWGSSLSS